LLLSNYPTPEFIPMQSAATSVAQLEPGKRIASYSFCGSIVWPEPYTYLTPLGFPLRF